MKLEFTKTLGSGLWKIPLLLLCMAFGSHAFAQTAVSGKVTNSATGEALIGATVVEEGTTNGTSTDIDGDRKSVV